MASVSNSTHLTAGVLTRNTGSVSCHPLMWFNIDTLLLLFCQSQVNSFTHHLCCVSGGLKVWRLFCGRLVCLDVKDAFCSSLLIYNFRVFERRFGTRKFAVSM